MATKDAQNNHIVTSRAKSLMSAVARFNSLVVGEDGINVQATMHTDGTLLCVHIIPLDLVDGEPAMRYNPQTNQVSPHVLTPEVAH